MEFRRDLLKHTDDETPDEIFIIFKEVQRECHRKRNIVFKKELVGNYTITPQENQLESFKLEYF